MRTPITYYGGKQRTGVTILSLFDGMSCGQIALSQLGIPISKYYASEIDKFAVQQVKHNFPETIQLGDVEKWREWEIDWGSIDLVLAGSPCQGFSFAGKQLAFDDPRSRLFFVFVDILNHIKKLNPDVKFLLENVDMKDEYMRVISEYVGVFPVNINSNLVSAQNRNRWYWTNIRTRKEGLFRDIISDIPQPKNKGIFLRNIIGMKVDEKYYLSDDMIKWLYKHANKRNQKITFLTAFDKAKCICVSSLKRNLDTNYIAVHSEYNTIVNNIYDVDNNVKIRVLTPAECSRLQTIPDWYKWIVSDTQIYRMLGNGWTVEVISHVLSFWDYKSVLQKVS